MKIITALKHIFVRKMRSEGFTAEVDSGTGKVKANIPKDVKVNESTFSGVVKRLSAMFRPSENIYKEPSDKTVKGRVSQEEKLPERWSEAILPAGRSMHGKRVNIDALKTWVRGVVFSGMTNRDLVNEYNSLTDRKITTNLSNRQKGNLIDSLAYKVGRKIWYVGRKPSNLTDSEWDSMTKHMRPAEGSYGGNDAWKKFPYTEGYRYSSGVFSSGQSPVGAL